MHAEPDTVYHSDDEDNGDHRYLHHLRQTQQQQQLPPQPEFPLPSVEQPVPSPKPTPPLRLRLKLTNPIEPPPTTVPDTDQSFPVAATYEMAPNTRRSARNPNHTHPSGSEYSTNGGSVHSASSLSPVDARSRSRKTRAAKPSYDDDYDEDDYDELIQKQSQPVMTTTTSSRGRTIKLRNPNMAVSEDEDDEEPIRGPGLRRGVQRGVPRKRRDSFIEDDIDDDDPGDDGSQGYNTRARSKKPVAAGEHDDNNQDDGDVKPPTRPRAGGSRRAQKRRTARDIEEEGDYVDDGPSHSEIDADGSVDHDDPIPSTPEEPPQRTPTPEDNGGYGLRKRNAKVNYALPPPLAPDEIGPNVNGNSNGGVDNLFLNGNSKGKPKPGQREFRKVVPWGIGARFGAPAGRLPPRRGDDSDSDVPGQTPRRPFGAPTGAAASGLYPAGGMGPSELAATAAGTPSNLGKIGTDTALADADPLGVNQNVTFDEVGGLDDHIRQLEEMVRLPLLYPEIFQQHHVTPPRGVLFHGPPGTGKTLVARALAASSRSGGKSITFFMRKGADALSKWVGEAERQLRLLFEEARACQPSIIFFDEIDGLAPVRSSKQDQIHASIVSTLLALMDGMDGRGQVIVIGATNRPDAIDPALRRPGRFDRELYFPLPSLPARHRILSILTKDWHGWDGGKGEDTRAMLAKATKGYGGADLRALATEATLNAVQRRYPQIYKSKERLLVDPESIIVQARDFMIALKKMVPSSARSAASEAKPLPSQLVPLLGETFEEVKKVLDKALPQTTTRSVLEEAEFEDDEEDGSLEREMMLQAMETLRVHRPRVALCGPAGMGQAYIGAAALHHMEGTQVQSLDLATLMSDSTRTVEAAIVQLFVEAKRHKPSVVYIPSLISWCAAVSETARTTVRTMLDSLSPTDPLLLLAIVDGDFTTLPKDVRAWFGHNRQNRVVLTAPDREKRDVFFQDLLLNIERPPTQFPDGVPRRKRVLEILPVAPPLPPRQPTAAEIATQAENDERMKAMLTHRLGPVLQDIKRKFKRFTKTTRMEYDLESDPTDNPDWSTPVEAPVEAPPPPPPAPVDADGDAPMVNGSVPPVAEESPAVEAPLAIPRWKQFFDMDLEKMHARLYYEGYLTPKEFLEDISKIVANAEIEPIDNERLFKAQAMYHAINATLLSWEPQFAVECERMAQREHERRSQRKHDKSRAFIEEVGRGSPTVEAYAPGTRRSGRTNGLEPEVPFTPNPERKLKRPRAQGEHEGSQASVSPPPRSPKRARTVSEDSPPTLDALAEPSTAEPSDVAAEAQHGRSVRFANHLGVAEHDAISLTNGLNGVPEISIIPTPFTSGLIPDDVAPTHTAQTSAITEEDPPMLLSTSGSMYGPMTGVLDTLIPPAEVQAGVETAEDSQPTPVPQTQPPSTSMHSLASILITPPDAVMEEVVPPPRTPTPPPPHPDFSVDQDLLGQLKAQLLDRTADFTVEQLEQLRAVCLGAVWKHRSSWNRDDMVKDLLGVLDEFAAEVMAEDADSP